MKLTCHTLLIAIICISMNLLISFNSIADDTDKWVKCGTTNEAMIYYDKSSISKHDNLATVSTKHIYYNIKDAIRAWCGKKTENCKYKNLQYLLVLNEYDCSAKTSFVKSYSLCDKAGLVLGTFNNDNDTRNAISPNSIDERVYDVVCGKNR